MIGLDTGHLVYNYGTKLQAYAMQTLLEQNGERCEIIQWHKRNFGIFNRVVDQYKVLKKIYVGFGKRMKYWPKVMERYLCIQELFWQMERTSHKPHESPLLSSDQSHKASP